MTTGSDTVDSLFHFREENIGNITSRTPSLAHENIAPMVGTNTIGLTAASATGGATMRRSVGFYTGPDGNILVTAYEAPASHGNPFDENEGSLEGDATEAVTDDGNVNPPDSSEYNGNEIIDWNDSEGFDFSPVEHDKTPAVEVFPSDLHGSAVHSVQNIQYVANVDRM